MLIRLLWFETIIRHYFWQLVSVTDITISCIDWSICLSLFSQPYRFWERCKKILQICLQAIFPWNIGEDKFWPSHSDSLPSNLNREKFDHIIIFTAVWSWEYAFIYVLISNQRELDSFKTALFGYIFLTIALNAFDMEYFCRPVTWTFFGCRKLDSLKVALLGFYLDNRPRLPWREFIYSAHHVHGWQSQAASHRELDSITSANLGLHLISTTASDACEEKYFIYRVHHLRGFLS